MKPILTLLLILAAAALNAQKNDSVLIHNPSRFATKLKLYTDAADNAEKITLKHAGWGAYHQVGNDTLDIDAPTFRFFRINGQLFEAKTILKPYRP